MLIGVYIFLEDDFQDPIYGEPARIELPDGVWAAIGEIVSDALEAESDPRGVTTKAGHQIGWRSLLKWGLSFVVVTTTDIRPQQVEQYLRELGNRYFDEVADLRHPERDGVADVVVDVIPPWED